MSRPILSGPLPCVHSPFHISDSALCSAHCLPAKSTDPAVTYPTGPIMDAVRWFPPILSSPSVRTVLRLAACRTASCDTGQAADGRASTFNSSKNCHYGCARAGGAGRESANGRALSPVYRSWGRSRWWDRRTDRQWRQRYRDVPHSDRRVRS